MKNIIEAFLGNLSPEAFMKSYWDKKPLFVKNAISNAEKLISKNELLDYATDDSIESRIIIKDGGDYSWQALNGPFSEDVFDKFNNNPWTLLNQGMNRVSKNISTLEKYISFIPRWKFDDVMVSYASDDGGVGPHFDRYNVFIIQGEGKRSWKLQYNPDFEIIEDLDIIQLKNFKADVEYILESGDMIYIPPLVGHWGVSIGESISYSLGFRSIDYTEIVKGYSHSVLSQFSSDEFYIDKNGTLCDSEETISKAELSSLNDIVLKEMSNEEKITGWIKLYLSEPKEYIEENEGDFDTLLNEYDLHVDPRTKYLVDGDGVYINGSYYNCGKFIVNNILKVLDTHPSDSIDKSLFKRNEEVFEFVKQLYFDGAFFFNCE